MDLTQNFVKVVSFQKMLWDLSDPQIFVRNHCSVFTTFDLPIYLRQSVKANSKIKTNDN